MDRRDPTAGNARLTATTAVLLLILLAAEGVTILSIRPLLSAHIVIGLLLIPPVALKLLSTGYRFFRYYRVAFTPDCSSDSTLAQARVLHPTTEPRLSPTRAQHPHVLRDGASA